MKDKEINLASLKKSLQLFLLFFIVLSSSLLAQTGHWTQLYPAKSPPARISFAMSPIGENQVIIFGGEGNDSKALGDTWIYDLISNTWTELQLTNSPSPRLQMNFAAIDSHRVLLFGGINQDIKEKIYDDTWIFDLDSLKWIEMHPKTHPIKMYDYSMTSLVKGKVCLYGGTDTTQYMFPNDTWIYDYDSNNWTMVLFHENYFQGSAIAKIKDNWILKYGGSDKGLTTQRTSIYYTGLKNFWKVLSFHGNPPPTARCAIEQIEINKVLLFGGAGNQDLLNETWLFNLLDTSWNKIEIDIKPPARYMHRLSKIGDRQILLFAGYSGIPYNNDTWLFTLDPTEVTNRNSLEKKLNLQIENISNKELKIIINSEFSGKVNYEIVSITGVIILKSNFYSDFIGNIIFNIDISFLPKGLYFLRLWNDTEYEVSKFYK